MKKWFVATAVVGVAVLLSGCETTSVGVGVGYSDYPYYYGGYPYGRYYHGSYYGTRYHGGTYYHGGRYHQARPYGGHASHGAARPMTRPTAVSHGGGQGGGRR